MGCAFGVIARCVIGRAVPFLIRKWPVRRAVVYAVADTWRAPPILPIVERSRRSAIDRPAGARRETPETPGQDKTTHRSTMWAHGHRHPAGDTLIA
eukprot:4042530-Prymnesium_polylepis.2